MTSEPCRSPQRAHSRWVRRVMPEVNQRSAHPPCGCRGPGGYWSANALKKKEESDMADHPNLELMKKGYDAFSKGDLESLKDLFAEDIIWHVPGNNPIAGDYKGQDEVFGFFMRL